jgi:hypothetical protein
VTEPSTDRRRAPPRRWLIFFIVLALLGLAAILVPIVVNLWLQLTAEQIAEARQHWHEQAPADYDLEYLVQVETAGVKQEDEYAIAVRHGRAVLVLCNGEKLPLHAASRRGVDGLLDEMERRLAEARTSGDRSYARASFDPRDGHPTHYVHRSRRAHQRIEWTLKLTRRQADDRPFPGYRRSDTQGAPARPAGP